MLFKEDASFYAEQVRNGEVTCVELVNRALENIKNLNPALNAVVHIQADQAISMAEKYDREKAGILELPPFYGVPILVKDLGQNEAGQPSGCGSNLLKGAISPAHSHFVEKLLEAGFIIVGRTNVPEFGFKNISDSAEFGAVNLPADLSRNPGGSSGGAAAALKSGMVPVVTASDGGGSIRIPASFSGLIGLKTSRGRTPTGPGSYRGWQGASVDFFLTKSVRDTFALLKCMQIYQPEAPFCVPEVMEKKLEANSRPLKIAYSLNSPIGNPVTDTAKEAVMKTVEELKKMGHETICAEPETDGIEAMRTYFIVNAVETAAMFGQIESNMPRSIEIGDMELMSWALYQAGTDIGGIEYSGVLNYWDNLAAKTNQFFEDYDIFLIPTVNGTAPQHGHFDLSSEMKQALTNIDSLPTKERLQLVWDMFEESLFYTPFTQQQNLTGQPAISLPIYKDGETQLPQGVQLSARKGEEYLLLSLSKTLEDRDLLNAGITEITETIK